MIDRIARGTAMWCLVIAIVFALWKRSVGAAFAVLGGGLLIGIVESLSVGYIEDFTGGRLNSAFRDLVVFSILIVFMLVRPQGLFGKPEVKKV